MATETSIENLRNTIDELLAYKEKELIKRPEWGEINFEQIEFTFQRLWDLVEHLKVLPIEYLLENISTNTTKKINEIKEKLNEINEFSISVANPSQSRDQLGNQLNQLVNQLYSIVAIWIPFLAYQKGDVSNNIQELSTSVKQANKEVEEARKEIEKKHGQIDKIISTAREASASAGAAVFTEDFLNEANDLNDESFKWLGATIALAVITGGIAIYMWFFGPGQVEENHVWLLISTKLTIFVLLFTATLWCGKIYRALKHQASTNKQKALGLKTFQAFSSAAADDQTKNAVLLETTRSIFNNTPTGLIESNSSNENDSKVIEIIKSVVRTEE